MILKRFPEDFKVTEIPKVSEDKKGNYSVYKLTKCGIDTYGALYIIRHKFNLSPNDIGVAGLKDKHAMTMQYISIKGRHGNSLNIKERSFSLEFVFYTKKKIAIGYLRGNSFEITIRRITIDDIKNMKKNSEFLNSGIPNYYGEQRFGSYSSAKAFLGKKLIKKQYDEAIKIYLTSTTKGENTNKRKLKNYIKKYWGLWGDCLSLAEKLRLGKTLSTGMLLHLKKSNNDYYGAVKMIPRSYVRLYIEAYQSFVWNEAARKIIQNTSKRLFTVPYRAGEYFFFEDIDKEILSDLKKISFNLTEIEAPEKVSQIISKALDDVAKKEEISLDDLKKPFFDAGEIKMRKLILVPRDFSASAESNDEVYNKYKKITLSFTLPKGSYATMVTRRLFKQ